MLRRRPSQKSAGQKSAGLCDPDAPRLRRLSHFLRERFGERVYKVALQGGFSCPNRDGTLGEDGCAFCGDEALQPSSLRPGMSIGEQLATGIDYVQRRHKTRKVIAYLQDHSATYGELGQLASIYEQALSDPRVVGLAVGTRPDCVPEPVVRLLSGLRARTKVLWVELGLQIASDALLEAIGRGHSVADFVEATERCQRAGIDVCAHVIVGLPGASPGDERRTIALLNDLGVWGVKLHAFHVVRGTAMARELEAGRLDLLDLGAYVGRVVDLLEQLRPEVVVHRVTAEVARRLTLAPAWTINKMVVYDAVLAELDERRSHQGAKLLGRTRV